MNDVTITAVPGYVVVSVVILASVNSLGVLETDEFDAVS